MGEPTWKSTGDDRVRESHRNLDAEPPRWQLDPVRMVEPPINDDPNFWPMIIIMAVVAALCAIGIFLL